MLPGILSRPWLPLALAGCCLLLADVTSSRAAEEDVRNRHPIHGTLIGQVLMSPTRPVERIDHPAPPSPVPSASIKIVNLTDQSETVVITDKHGQFRAELPPGRYRIDVKRTGRYPRPENLPATITIRKGQETRFDIRMDSGIR